MKFLKKGSRLDEDQMPQEPEKAKGFRDILAKSNEYILAVVDTEGRLDLNKLYKMAKDSFENGYRTIGLTKKEIEDRSSADEILVNQEEKKLGESYKRKIDENDSDEYCYDVLTDDVFNRFCYDVMESWSVGVQKKKIRLSLEEYFNEIFDKLFPKGIYYISTRNTIEFLKDGEKACEFACDLNYFTTDENELDYYIPLDYSDLNKDFKKQLEHYKLYKHCVFTKETLLDFYDEAIEKGEKIEKKKPNFLEEKLYLYFIDEFNKLCSECGYSYFIDKNDKVKILTNGKSAYKMVQSLKGNKKYEESYKRKIYEEEEGLELSREEALKLLKKLPNRYPFDVFRKAVERALSDKADKILVK